MNDEPVLSDEKAPPESIAASGTLRLLFYDHWFRLFAIVFVLLMLFLGIVLPRVWLRSPPDFNPPVRVSALDLFQARSLSKKAAELAKAGQIKDSMVAWSAAMANDSANRQFIHGAIRTVLSEPKPEREYLPFCYEKGLRLLRLGGTNVSDLGLVLEFLGRYELHEYVTNLAAGRAGELPPEAAAALLKSYFQLGDLVSFGSYWEARSKEFAGKPELEMLRLGWEANWGPPGLVMPARAKLAAARREPATLVAASRVQLVVSEGMRDPGSYEEALNQLRDRNEDRVIDHVRFWRLLAIVGRKDEAEKRIRNFVRSPETPAELLSLAATYEALGLNDAAVQLVEKEIPRFGFVTELWVLQSRQLARLKRWVDLRALAVAMRSSDLLAGALDGYAYYLEALAETNLDRPDTARDLMRRSSTGRFSDAALAFNTARAMRAGGFPEYSVELLDRWRGSFSNQPDFWFAMTAAAFEARDVKRLIEGAERAYALKPDEIEVMNNYAAMLLATRRDPAKAMELTSVLKLRRPNDRGMVLNHALALAQARQSEQAELILKSFNTVDLTPVESSVYNLAWYEVHLNRKAADLARASYARIDQRSLLKPVIEWLEQTYRSLPPG